MHLTSHRQHALGQFKSNMARGQSTVSTKLGLTLVQILRAELLGRAFLRNVFTLLPAATTVTDVEASLP